MKAGWILLKITLIVIIVAPIVLSLILALMQDSLIFAGTSFVDQSTSQHIIRRNPELHIQITVSDGTKLSGFYLARKPENHLVIIFGGNGDDAATYVLMEKHFPDVNLLAFNYRGYGLSEGKPSEKLLVSDAREILIYAHKELGYPMEKIVIFGRSLGTGVACQIAASNQVNSLILVSPYESLTNVASEFYPFLPVSLVMRHPFHSYQYVDKIICPVEIIYSEIDEIVSAKRTKALIPYFKSSPKIHVIHDQGHNSITMSKVYRDALLNALAAKIPAMK